MTAWFEGTRTLFACVHMPEFPAQALLRLRPNLRGLPVAVVEGAPPHERVCAGNARARRDGLVRGMTRVEAESFAGMVVLARASREEEAARAALLACAGSFTPLVEACHTDTTAVCVLDVQGMARLYPDARTFAVALRRALLSRGLRGSIAVSTNFHATRALAEGRSGITIAAPGEEQKALASLLLHVLEMGLGLDEQQLNTLSLWGIQTLGGVAALPQKELIARMGQAGKRLRALARGEHPHLFAPVAVPRELRETFSFEAPVRLMEGILFVLSPMLEQLLVRVREDALAISALTVTLALGARALDTEDDGRSEAIDRLADTPHVAPTGNGHAAIHLLHGKPELLHGKPEATAEKIQRVQTVDEAVPAPGQTHKRTVRPTVPTSDKRLLLKLLQLDLAAHPPASSVLSIVLEAEAAKTGAVQSGLFAPPLPEPSRLDVTLARLSALVGEDRVGSPVLRDTHTPDSFSMKRFSNELTATRKQPQSAAPVPALRLLRPPEPVTVHAEHGQPVRFWFRSELYHVRTACGPWRLSGAWWSSERWAYECWDVAAERSGAEPIPQQGLRPLRAPAVQLSCRLRWNAERAQWLVEGMYD